jgi:signal transduction histidine kinase
MITMPLWPDWARSPLTEGIIDASLLTLATAPALWWLAVRPMRQLSEARGQLLHRLFHAQEQERSRIARDLHDDIGQQLTALLVGLKTIDSSATLDSAKARAADLHEAAASAHKEVRRLARGLRPGVLEELRLEAAIEQACEEFQAVYSVPVECNVSSAACSGLTTTIETSLYRIMQEALTNAARHAKASRVEVALGRQHDRVVLQIADDGQGFHLAENGHSAGQRGTIGLASIRERALMLGGDCTIHSEPGKGTTVQVSIPVTGPTNA